MQKEGGTTVNRYAILVAAVVMAATQASDSRAQEVKAKPYRDYSWFVDVMPASIHANFTDERFRVQYTDVGDRNVEFVNRESLSLLSSLPTIAGGLAIETDTLKWDAKAGVGMLLNAQLRSPMIFVGTDVLWQMKQSIWLGPHLGFNWYTNPEWWGQEADIDFGDSSGLNGGLGLVMGDKLSYILSVDYYQISFDVDRTGPGVTANNSEVDMSGIAVQFGVRGYF
jgi:hypothetical protein